MAAKYIISVILFIVLLDSWVFGNFLVFERNSVCAQCENVRCNVLPDECAYGRSLNSCGLYVCKKGPGKRCGGHNNEHGVCGDGMSCTCSKCTGCYTETVDCMDPEEERNWKRLCHSKVVNRRGERFTAEDIIF